MLVNVLILLFGVVSNVFCIFPEFDDQLHYSISWNGALSEQSDKANSLEKVVVTTNENERYQCLLPTVKGNEEGASTKFIWKFVSISIQKKCLCAYFFCDENGTICDKNFADDPLDYENKSNSNIKKEKCFNDAGKEMNLLEIDDSNGPSAELLLADMFLGKLNRCSFRLEPYWAYELCHGQKLVQFHEEKDIEGVSRKSEFVLGKLTKAEVREILSPSKPIPPTGKDKKVPTRKIDNKDTPYYSIEMENGTPCDLSGEPRKTNVLYICHPGANNEIVSIKEVTTCQYEALVLTPYLCGNPAYVLKNKVVNTIQCHAMSGSPRTPKKLSDYAPISRQAMPAEKTTPKNEQNKATKPGHHGSAEFKPTDKTINVKFLKGDYCLHGGTGWWKYEFCNGKHLVQYHVEPNGQKTVIVVGRWDKKIHLDRIKNNKIKAKSKNYVTHFYSGGQLCELTGKHRTAHVMLICKEGEGQPLSIYMTEDKPCEYTVGVESPILCPYVKGAGEDGIFIE